MQLETYPIFRRKGISIEEIEPFKGNLRNYENRVRSIEMDRGTHNFLASEALMRRPEAYCPTCESKAIGNVHVGNDGVIRVFTDASTQ